MSKSKILLIDSVHAELFVAFIDGDNVTVRTCAEQKAHDRNLNKLTSEFIGISDAFAVVTGPGSWTGSRVGVVAVKAYSIVTGKPIIALMHDMHSVKNRDELIAEAKRKFAAKEFTTARDLAPYYDSEFRVTTKK